MDYGREFNAYRRIVQQEFQPAVVAANHRAVIAAEVANVLARTLAALWLARWRKRVAAWTCFAAIWALLVFARRLRVP